MNTQETAYLLTLNEAAAKFGRSKGTLSKAVATGDLSVKSKKGKAFQLDPAEVDRWCKANPLKKPKTSSENHLETPENPTGNSDLQLEVERLREQINSKNTETRLLTDQIEDLKEQRDKWEKQASNQTRLLTHEQERTQRLEQQPEPQGGIFKKLFGVG